jgi:hypothetical protein
MRALSKVISRLKPQGFTTKILGRRKPWWIVADVGEKHQKVKLSDANIAIVLTSVKIVARSVPMGLLLDRGAV